MNNRWHNPIIDIVHLSDSFSDEEILIKRLHFIWLGSSLTKENSKNVAKYVNINRKSEYDFFIWYDSRLIDDEQFQDTYKFVNTLNSHKYTLRVYLCDVVYYSLFYDDFIKNSYEYEIGLIPRPGINPLAVEIKNYGMSTDVLRMCILKLYGGFYMDIDMMPINLEQYHRTDKIKTCPLRFCIALSSKPDYTIEEDDSEVYSNIYENYDDYYDYRAKYGDEVFDEKWYFEYIYEEDIVTGLINNGLYYDPSFDRKGYINLYFDVFKRNYTRIMEHNYYGYLLRYRNTTITSSGPGVFIELFTERNDDYRELSSRKAVLRDIIEDREQSTHSWITISKYRDILSVLIYELFLDVKMIALTYLFFNSDDESVTIRDKIKTILATYFRIFNEGAIYMYNGTPTYNLIMDTLIDRIMMNDYPSIGLYINLAESLNDIPGPYIMAGFEGNYTKEERNEAEIKFKSYMSSFLVKYIN